MPPKDQTDLAADPGPTGPSRRTLLAGAAGLGLATGFASAASATGHTGDRPLEFAGKSALVTGGARGIGYACAEALARAGANIVLYDVAGQIDHVPYPLATAEDLAAAQSSIEALGVGCIAVQGDVRDGAGQRDAANRAVAEFGSLDIAIANAGITQVGLLDEFSEAEVDVVLDVNLAGAIKTVQAAVPTMRAQNSGRIVLMSSVTGRAGSEYFPIYSASKWGMIGLTKSTARLLGPFNVTCNAVCPSLVHTKLLDNDYVLGAMIPDNPTAEALDAGARQRHILPVGLFGAEHVAAAVTFLCSDAASLITGDVFDVAGGINSGFPA